MSVKLPAVAGARMAALRSSGTWGSALTADEFAAIRSVGFEPVGQVFGAAVYSGQRAYGHTGGPEVRVKGSSQTRGCSTALTTYPGLNVVAVVLSNYFLYPGTGWFRAERDRIITENASWPAGRDGDLPAGVPGAAISPPATGRRCRWRRWWLASCHPG